MEHALSGKATQRTKNGKPYWVQNYYLDDGTRRQSSGKTAIDAKKKALAVIEKSLSGDMLPKKDDALTFEAFSAEFLDACRVGRSGAAPLDADTIRSYESKLKNWINPIIGDVPVKDLKRKHISDMVDNLLKAQTNRTSVQKNLTLVRIILNHAKRTEVITRIPGEDIRVETDWAADADRKEDRIPSLDEMRKIEDAARNSYNANEYNVRNAYQRYYPLFLILRTTGMRISECLALQWGDFSKDFRNVTIKRKISPPLNNRTMAERVRKPKTKNSRRTIPLPTSISPYLKAWKEQCPVTPEGWIFPTRNGTPMSYHNVRSKFWLPLLERAGVRNLGIHGMRHYYASYLIREGKAKQASEYLGHHSVAFTMDQYGHLFPDDAEMREQVCDIITGGSNF